MNWPSVTYTLGIFIYYARVHGIDEADGADVFISLTTLLIIFVIILVGFSLWRLECRQTGGGLLWVRIGSNLMCNIYCRTHTYYLLFSVNCRSNTRIDSRIDPSPQLTLRNHILFLYQQSSTLPSSTLSLPLPPSHTPLFWPDIPLTNFFPLLK